MQYAHAAHPAWALTANKLPEPKSNGSPTLDNVIFMDGMRRVVQTRADAEVRGVLGATCSGRVEYDAMGRVSSQGQVTFPSSPKTSDAAVPSRNPTTFVHDVLGRNVLVFQPDASHGDGVRLRPGGGRPDPALPHRGHRRRGPAACELPRRRAARVGGGGAHRGAGADDALSL